MDVSLSLQIDTEFPGDAFLFIANQTPTASFAQGYLPRTGSCSGCAGYEGMVARPVVGVDVSNQ